MMSVCVYTTPFCAFSVTSESSQPINKALQPKICTPVANCHPGKYKILHVIIYVCIYDMTIKESIFIYKTLALTELPEPQ